MNKIIAGDYLNNGISQTCGKVFIVTGWTTTIDINKDTVENYELIDETKQKSFSSGLMKGVIGGAVFGGIGALAGIATAKNKGVYHIALNFRDGKKSLVECNEKIYKAIIKLLF